MYTGVMQKAGIRASVKCLSVHLVSVRTVIYLKCQCYPQSPIWSSGLFQSSLSFPKLTFKMIGTTEMITDLYIIVLIASNKLFKTRGRQRYFQVLARYSETKWWPSIAEQVSWLPFVIFIVGDDIFPLKPGLMKPYPGQKLWPVSNN